MAHHSRSMPSNVGGAARLGCPWPWRRRWCRRPWLFGLVAIVVVPSFAGVLAQPVDGIGNDWSSPFGVTHVRQTGEVRVAVRA